QVNPFTNTYTFPSVDAYLAAKNGTKCPTINSATGQPFPSGSCYSTYATQSGGGAAYKSYFYGFYVQDSWQIRPDLLMIYGVRWDRYQAPPGEVNAPFIYTRNFTTPNRDWAPRIGFAWKATPKTVVRLNAGMFYEPPATNLWFNAINNDGLHTYTNTLGPAAA